MKKTKKVIKEIFLLSLWILKSGAKWPFNAFPKNGHGASIFINLIALNYLIWVIILLPIAQANIKNTITIPPKIIIQEIIKIQHVDKIVYQIPITSAEERYANLLQDNKAFRTYINNLDIKRCNPGNLRCRLQPNSTCENGFAKFPDNTTGFRALIKQLELDQARNLSLEEFLNKYSPPNENDTEWLIKVASEKLGIERDELISYINTIDLAIYIVNQEYSIEIVEY